MLKRTKKQLALRAKWNREWIAKNRSRYNEAKSEYRFKLKLAALKHYSDGRLSCAQCGYSEDIDALCLDHVNDDGAHHRRGLGVGGMTSVGNRAGTTLYERLKALGWMPGLQVLCFNCNAIKEIRRKRGKTASEMFVITTKVTRWKA